MQKVTCCDMFVHDGLQQNSVWVEQTSRPNRKIMKLSRKLHTGAAPASSDNQELNEQQQDLLETLNMHQYQGQKLAAARRKQKRQQEILAQNSEHIRQIDYGFDSNSKGKIILPVHWNAAAICKNGLERLKYQHKSLAEDARICAIPGNSKAAMIYRRRYFPDNDTRNPL
ncbi:Hypothetical predicted protein [Octopus vulgaris]|uniref:Uncharacterized protein n=1 Tax=Octopus vulgaris TaxID=6645 RepID=A0AA36AXE8_OCTVU|nr:Hypothetical predicted protein [Octopus vulgaris]